MLVSCLDCDQQISDKASSCPQCGYRRTSAAATIALGVFAGLALWSAVAALALALILGPFIRSGMEAAAAAEQSRAYTAPAPSPYRWP